MRPAAFAIPGDHTQKTGGFIYERRLLEELQAAGRAVRHIALPPHAPVPTPADTAAVVAALATVPPDMPLILDGLVFGSLQTRALAGLACPVIAMLHHPMGLETGLPAALAAALLARERANLAHAAHVVVTSAHTARTYVELLGADPARITVAPPGYDRPRDGMDPAEPDILSISPLAERIGRDASPPRTLPADPQAGRDVADHDAPKPLILSVGLLAARKGHDVLLRALALIADLDWTAEIVGKTHDAAVERGLLRLAGELGLETRVGFRGEIGDAALAERYRTARLFALATRYEGYGMALAEALAGGLPIVTCRTGAVPDTVGDAAILVAPDDPAAFAAALRHLLTDSPARDALAARARARGRLLPAWSDTAAIVGRVLDRAGL